MDISALLLKDGLWGHLTKKYVCVVRNKILVFYSGSLVWILFYRECWQYISS